MKLDKKKAITTGIFIAVGLAAGFAYWRFVGCSSGSCPLTSNWYSSTLIGGFFGYALSDIKPKKKKVEEVEQ